MAWGRSPSDSSRTDDPREACCSCARPGSRFPWWASGRARRFRFSHCPSVPSGSSPGSTTPRDCRSSRASSRSRAEEWAGTAWAGASGLALALGAIGQVVSGRLADRRQSERILFGLSVAAATVLVLLAVLPPGGAFTTAALLFGFLLFSLEPLQNILVTGEVPGPLRGLAFGFTFLSVFGIGSLGSALAGWLIANHASAILFLVLGGFLAASWTAFLCGRRRFNA